MTHVAEEYVWFAPGRHHTGEALGIPLNVFISYMCYSLDFTIFPFYFVEVLSFYRTLNEKKFLASFNFLTFLQPHCRKVFYFGFLFT